MDALTVDNLVKGLPTGTELVLTFTRSGNVIGLIGLGLLRHMIDAKMVDADMATYMAICAIYRSETWGDHNGIFHVRTMLGFVGMKFAKDIGPSLESFEVHRPVKPQI